MKRKFLGLAISGLMVFGLAACGSNVELNVYGVTTFDAGKSIDNLSLDFYKNGEKTTFDINSDTYPFELLYNLSYCEILSFGAFSVEMDNSICSLYTYEDSEETYTVTDTYYKNIKSDIYKYHERDNVTFELFESTDDESNISGINGLYYKSNNSYSEKCDYTYAIQTANGKFLYDTGKNTIPDNVSYKYDYDSYTGINESDTINWLSSYIFSNTDNGLLFDKFYDIENLDDKYKALYNILGINQKVKASFKLTDKYIIINYQQPYDMEAIYEKYVADNCNSRIIYDELVENQVKYEIWLDYNNMETVKRDSQKVTQIDLSYMNYSCEYKYTHDKHFGYSSSYKLHDEITRTSIKISKLDDSNYEKLRTKFITKCKKNNSIIDKSIDKQ